MSQVCFSAPKLTKSQDVVARVVAADPAPTDTKGDAMPDQRISKATHAAFPIQVPALRLWAWSLRWRGAKVCQHGSCTSLARSMPAANSRTRAVTADILALHGLLHQGQPLRRAIEPRLIEWPC